MTRFRRVCWFSWALLALGSELPALAQCRTCGVMPGEGQLTHLAPDPALPGTAMVDFADSLYEQQRFFESVTAYESAAFFAPDPATKKRALLGVALSYHLGHHVREAVAAYDRWLAEVHAEPEELLSVQIDRTVAAWEGARARRDHDVLSAEAARLEGLLPITHDRQRLFAAFHLARFYTYAARYNQARETITAVDGQCAASSSADCRALASLKARLLARPPDKKHPIVGAVLSSVVPGGGALYAEHYVDAIFYALAIGSTAWMAWDVYNVHDGFGRQTPTFYVLGGLSTLFYGVNVVQGWSMTARLNAINDAHHEAWMQSGALAPLLLDPVEFQPFDSPRW